MEDTHLAQKKCYDPVETGKRIRQFRKAQGMTQEQMAEKLHISTVHLKKIETGGRRCSLDILIEISSFFDTSLDYLALGNIRKVDLRVQVDSAIRALEKLRENL